MVVLVIDRQSGLKNIYPLLFPLTLCSEKVTSLSSMLTPILWATWRRSSSVVHYDKNRENFRIYTTKLWQIRQTHCRSPTYKASRLFDIPGNPVFIELFVSEPLFSEVLELDCVMLVVWIDCIVLAVDIVVSGVFSWRMTDCASSVSLSSSRGLLSPTAGSGSASSKFCNSYWFVSYMTSTLRSKTESCPSYLGAHCVVPIVFTIDVKIVLRHGSQDSTATQYEWKQ